MLYVDYAQSNGLGRRGGAKFLGLKNVRGAEVGELEYGIHGMGIFHGDRRVKH